MTDTTRPKPDGSADRPPLPVVGPLSDARVLFLDDSGHPAPRHASRAIVIGGFSIASASVPTLHRRIAGAKARFFPEHGHPSQWEVKATQIIRPNTWKRQQNRSFVSECVRILQGLDCTVYTASIKKANMHHPMRQQATMPLQFQALVQHFAVECAHHHDSGLIVMDRSNDGLDAHVSNCVGTYVASHRLPLHPTIYYADSTTSHAIQISDLISGSHRRAIEGDSNMHDLDRTLAAICRTDLSTRRTHTGRHWTNRIVVF
ncbi:MAG: DUF3800 domain-containing protein [bacterium]|nr:DUF3800 domain-containing protein [bacterium]